MKKVRVNNDNVYVWIAWEEDVPSSAEALTEPCTLAELLEWLPNSEDFAGELTVCEPSFVGELAVRGLYRKDEEQPYYICFRAEEV